MFTPICYAIEAMTAPKFLTLTFNPEYLPKLYHNATDDKIAELAVMAVRHNNAWKNFRKHVLDKLPKWIRVTEFGPTGRIHIHLAIDDPDDRLPLLHFGKHEPFSKFIRLVNSNQKALEFYTKIHGYGFGIFNCQNVYSNSGMAGYITSYVAKPLPPIFRSSALRKFRTYGISRACAKIQQLPKRHCYKMDSIQDGVKSAGISEIPLPVTAMIHDFDTKIIRIADYEFQLGDTKLSLDFMHDVEDLFDARKKMNNARAKIRSQRFCDFWSNYTKPLRDDLYFYNDGFFLQTAADFIKRYQLDDLSSLIIVYVLLWYRYYKTLSRIRFKHNCTATIRFLYEVVFPLNA